MNEFDLRRQLLNASRGAEQLQAVSNVITSMIAGVDVSGLFPDMLKVFAAGFVCLFLGVVSLRCNVCHQAVECNDFRQKRLVYLYVCNFSRDNKDLSMMAINTLQKDFRHANPLVRAAALTAMASLQCVAFRRASALFFFCFFVLFLFCFCFNRILSRFRVVDLDQFLQPMLESALVDAHAYVRRALVFSCLQRARNKSLSDEVRRTCECMHRAVVFTSHVCFLRVQLL